MAIVTRSEGTPNELRVPLAELLVLLLIAGTIPLLVNIPGGARAATYFAIARNRTLMTLADDENYYDAIQRKSLIHAWYFAPSNDFRMYRYQPGMDWRTGAISTNRLGRVGPERSIAKPEHTWRIAVLGDSLVTGYRIPNSDTLPARLEQRLNADETAHPGESFEVMSFACPGYSLMQSLDTALEDVSPYHPDAYLVELSERSLYKQWDAQLVQIGNRGIDPKYDFIRRIFELAHVHRRDSVSVIHTKLAPYRIELLRETLQALQQNGARQHVPVVVVLLPAVEPGDLSSQRIHDAQQVYSGLGLQVLDLSDTFAKVIDTRPLLATLDDPSNLDVHPNGRAFSMMLDNFYRKLRAQPAVWTQLTGLNATAIPQTQ